MSVTLDVLKLSSGWLNATARCHVKCKAQGIIRCGKGCAPGGGRAWGGGGASSVQEKGPLKAVGGRAERSERTQNIWTMSVTLDVSKLSGWSNVTALCQVKCKAYEAGQGARWEAGRSGGGCGASGAQDGEDPTEG